MTLLVISPDFASHAGPLLTLASAWQQAGRRVVVATGPAVRGMVERAGMEHVELSLGRGSNAGVSRPEEQPAAERDSLRSFFEATRRGMLATLRYQAEARATDLLWRPIETARRTIAVVEATRPDRIVVDHLAFGATVGLRAAGIPYADVVLGHPRQLPVAGEVYGVPGHWPAAFEVAAEALAGLRAAGERVTRSFTDAYNSALAALSPSAERVADAFAAHGQVVLYNYPNALHDAARSASLPHLHEFVGSLVRHEELAPDVESWVDRSPDRPLVVVSLGTFLSARDDVLSVIADGLRRLPVRVAMATGAADVNRLGRLPAEWLVAPVLPQVALLDRASVLVTHAGNNSVTEAVSAGVPMVALPFSTDQFDGAAAVERCNLGRAADPNRIGPADVGTLVEAVLDIDRRPVAELGRQLARRPGPLAARAVVEGSGRPFAGARADQALESELVGR